MNFDYEITILTTGPWPVNLDLENPISIPGELFDLKVNFENFYQKSHEKRKLEWNMTQGNSELIMKLGGNSVILQCTNI